MEPDRQIIKSAPRRAYDALNERFGRQFYAQGDGKVMIIIIMIIRLLSEDGWKMVGKKSAYVKLLQNYYFFYLPEE